MNPTFDVVVIGAGFIGCSVAYHLTEARLKTALLDQGRVGGGASGANFGCIQTMDAELGHSLPMIKTGYAYFKRLEEELDCSVSLRRLGGLLLIENEAQWKIMEHRCKLLRNVGIEAEIVPAKQLPEIEPLLDPYNTLGALYHSHEGQIYPFALIWAYIRKGLHKGLSLFTDTTVTGFEVQSGCLHGVHTDRGAFSAGVTVLTTGAWTQELGRILGCSWDIPHIHGQAIVTEPVELLLRNSVASAAFFENLHEESNEPDSKAVLAMSQSPYGNFLLGEASHPANGFTTSLTHGGPRAIAIELSRFFPILRRLRVLRGWATSTAYTKDGLPFFGPVADLPGLILATAFRSTVIITPLAGETVTQLVVQGCSDLDLTHFSPDREMSYLN